MNNFDEVQLNKINNFRENGIEPYPHGRSTVIYETSTEKKKLLGAVRIQSVTELANTESTFAGRILFKNDIGNVGFARISFGDERLQLFVSKKELGVDTFKALWKKLDVGDIIQVRGSFMRTRMGELTLRVYKLELMSKCIKGMPDKVSGVTDSETMQRQRYLDLMVNSDSYDRFILRSKIIGRIRSMLSKREFIEVETPILQSIPGGATAKPFETHHNALNSDLFMRVAPELYLKRLIVGGFPRVFEIGKNFRNEGISTKHNPEFTMVEFYASYVDYEYLMELTEYMIQEIISNLSIELERLPPESNSIYKLPYGELMIDYCDWSRMTYVEALAVYVEDPWSRDSLQTFVLENTGLRIQDIPNDITKLWDIVFDQFVEPTLINPTFITHYPVEISPLARRNDNDPRVTDRFELFIGTYEVANGFNELNDPVEQAERFSEQARRKSNGDDEAMFYDEDYINALSYGMPPTAGEGIGIDRLVMLLTNSQNIRDIILFPTKNRK